MCTRRKERSKNNIVNNNNTEKQPNERMWHGERAEINKDRWQAEWGAYGTLWFRIKEADEKKKKRRRCRQSFWYVCFFGHRASFRQDTR